MFYYFIFHLTYSNLAKIVENFSAIYFFFFFPITLFKTVGWFIQKERRQCLSTRVRLKSNILFNNPEIQQRITLKTSSIIRSSRLLKPNKYKNLMSIFTNSTVGTSIGLTNELNNDSGQQVQHEIKETFFSSFQTLQTF